jgi:hypothetical protein
MSPYSTLNITRDDARMLIMKKMFNFTDEQMEDIKLFSIYGNKTLNNFNIIRQYEETSEDECSFRNHLQIQEWRFEQLQNETIKEKTSMV